MNVLKKDVGSHFFFISLFQYTYVYFMLKCYLQIIQQGVFKFIYLPIVCKQTR